MLENHLDDSKSKDYATKYYAVKGSLSIGIYFSALDMD